jgi:Flp pilus assembly pilin Flp
MADQPATNTGQQVRAGEAKSDSVKQTSRRTIMTGGGETMLNSIFAYITTLTLQLRREEGQTMAEYGILLGVIAVVVVVVAITLGTKITGVFTSASNGI